MADEEPKLHIDSDWKAEAQAEKERLAAEEAVSESKPGDGERQMPEATIGTLIEVLAAQAAMGLATMQDPETKGVMVDLEGSKFSIDLLGVIEEKTKGNLAPDEEANLRQALAGLRGRWVQVKQLVDQQAGMAGDPGSVAPGSLDLGAMGPGAGPVIG